MTTILDLRQQKATEVAQLASNYHNLLEALYLRYDGPIERAIKEADRKKKSRSRKQEQLPLQQQVQEQQVQPLLVEKREMGLDPRIPLSSQDLQTITKILGLLTLDRNCTAYGEPMVTSDDVDYLIRACFEIGERPKFRIIKTTMLKTHLRFFVYTIYTRMGKTHIDGYRNILKHFEFDNPFTEEELSSKFSKPCKLSATLLQEIIRMTPAKKQAEGTN